MTNKTKTITHKPVSTFLWFESQAQAAARMYCEIFPNAKIIDENPMSATFEIDGQRYIAFNGGPHYKLNPAVSIFVPCETQAEVDALWQRFLDAGSSEHRCGWLVDKYGLSWQIIPTQLMSFIGDPDPAKRERATAAMMTMQKIDIAAIERAHRAP